MAGDWVDATGEIGWPRGKTISDLSWLTPSSQQLVYVAGEKFRQEDAEQAATKTMSSQPTVQVSEMTRISYRERMVPRQQSVNVRRPFRRCGRRFSPALQNGVSSRPNF